MAGPLAGLRVIEIGANLSAAFGTRLFADLGAEVIKIEPASGDPMRRAGGSTAQALFGYLNHGKRSIVLDVSQASGAALLRDVASRADLLVCDAESLALIAQGGLSTDWPERPATVVASPYGLVGERARDPATPFVVQHASGFAFHQASPVSDPANTPPMGCADRESDLSIGLVVAIAALWALRASGDIRPGRLVDLSAEDVMTYLLVEPFADWQDGVDPANRQRDTSKGITIAGGLVWLLPCRTGHIMVSPREDHQWTRWMDVMGWPAWSGDAALCGDRFIRTRNAAALQALMAEWSIGQSSADVVAQAQAARVACYPISTPDDLLHNPQLAARAFFSTLALEDGRSLPIPGLPFRFTSSGGANLARGGHAGIPALGSETDAILVAAASGAPARRKAQPA